MESQEQMLQQIKIFEKLTDYKSQMIGIEWFCVGFFVNKK